MTNKISTIIPIRIIKNKESQPGFGLICPKCHRDNCVINVKGEPITTILEIEVKITLNIVCNDCKYIREYIK